MPIWGIAASPFVVDDKVIMHIGGEDACIVALDKKTGAEIWKSQNDGAQYSTPILISQGGKPVLVIWTADGVIGLNPADGKLYWREDMKVSKMPIGIVTPTISDNRLLVSSFYDGSLMLRINPDEPTVGRIWRKMGRDEQHTQSLHCVIGTPVIEGNYVYGVD